MTQHTPGPWAYLIDEATNKFSIYEDPDGRGFGQWIAEIHGPKTHYEANARLIAAAPSLLAACEAAHELLYHYDLARQPNGVDWGPAEMLRQEIIDKLEHAIAAARGTA